MGRSVNKVTIIGTLGRDPEIRYMPNGNAVANISVATDEGYKDRNTGQWVDKTEWHNIVAFGKLAEIIGEYLKKGGKVYFEGKLKTEEYEKDGIKRYITKIVASEMTMCSNPPQTSKQAASAAQGNNFSGNTPYPTGSQGAQDIASQNQPQAAPYPEQAMSPQQAAPQPSNAFDDFEDDIPF